MRAMASAVTLMFILLFLIFVTFIIVFLLCCGYFKKNDKNKFCCSFACLGFIVFITLAIVFIVYISLAQSKVNNILCNIFKLPAGIIDGFADK